MKLCKAYLFRQRRLLALLAVLAAVYGATAALYALPAEPVLYTLVLGAAACAVAFGFGLAGYARRCRALGEAQARAVQEAHPPLPEPADELEGRYQALVAAVCADRAQIAARAENQAKDMADYYTLWAHQIKTPIAAMHLLLQSPQPDAAQLDGELFKVEQYVEMVLSYLRMGSESSDFSFRRQPLDDIVRGAVRKYARLFILKHIRLDLAPTGLTVLTDEKWLGFVLEQLLSNALKYTPDGGSVRICAEDGALVLADSGIGISAEDLPRVCEKGFTGYNGRTDRKATGLGLYLSSQVCQKLGVSLRISAQPGQGTAVRLGFAQAQQRYE